MELKFKKEEENLIVEFEGRLDTTTSGLAEEEINKNLDGVSSMVFDFKKLDYISSAGLRLLLKYEKDYNQKGGLFIVNINDVIKEILSITGFDKILKIK